MHDEHTKAHAHTHNTTHTRYSCVTVCVHDGRDVSVYVFNINENDNIIDTGKPKLPDAIENTRSPATKTKTLGVDTWREKRASTVDDRRRRLQQQRRETRQLISLPEPLINYSDPTSIKRIRNPQPSIDLYVFFFVPFVFVSPPAPTLAPSRSITPGSSSRVRPIIYNIIYAAYIK